VQTLPFYVEIDIYLVLNMEDPTVGFLTCLYES